jgi:hypothetical protein
MKEALNSSAMSDLTRATWRSIPEDAILHLKVRSFLPGYAKNEHTLHHIIHKQTESPLLFMINEIYRSTSYSVENKNFFRKFGVAQIINKIPLNTTNKNKYDKCRK